MIDKILYKKKIIAIIILGIIAAFAAFLGVINILWGAINAVFNSWNGKRAIHYRNIENIPTCILCTVMSLYQMIKM